MPLADWQISPSIGAGIVDVDRDAFTASDGTRIGGARSTQLSLNAALNVGTSFSGDFGADGSAVYALHFGLSGFANVGRSMALTGAAGTVNESDRFGLGANAGLDATFDSGATVGFNAGVGGLTGDQKSYSLTAWFSPF
ncbi:MAG: hypothetical protein R3F55_16665 [Alphaproteobacteria bacterium]